MIGVVVEWCFAKPGRRCATCTLWATSADPALESWEVTARTDNVEIRLTSIADLTPSTARPDELAAADLARLMARHGSWLRRSELLRVVRGYLGPCVARHARRELVRRILDAREPAR